MDFIKVQWFCCNFILRLHFLFYHKPLDFVGDLCYIFSDVFIILCWIFASDFLALALTDNIEQRSYDMVIYNIFQTTDITESQKSVMKKGPSFVPTPKYVDWLSIRIGLDKFVSKLRYRYIRSLREEEEDSNSELS